MDKKIDVSRVNDSKCLEMKIYESLGIKRFKKLVLEIGYRSIRLFDRSLTREKYYKSSSNYRMKKGNGLDDLRKFKKMLFLNGGIHSLALIHNVVMMVEAISLGSFWGLALVGCYSVINGYCILLQRYNYLRIERVLKKGEPIEEKKKIDILEELKGVDHLSKQCSHTVITDRVVTTSFDSDEFKNRATLKELRKYRDFLIDVKRAEDETNYSVVEMGKGKYLEFSYYPKRKV